MANRNKRTAGIMIISVWVLAAVISLSPALGWYGDKTNYRLVNESLSSSSTVMMLRAQCTFVDLPSYTIYSATGSFFIPTLVMFFVYFKIYRAFAKVCCL
jgi:hypothetical protein